MKAIYQGMTVQVIEIKGEETWISASGSDRSIVKTSDVEILLESPAATIAVTEPTTPKKKTQPNDN